MTDDLCPACEVGELQACSGIGTEWIGGRIELIEGIEYMTCLYCGAQTFLPEQEAKNTETIATIRKALEWGI